MPLVYTNGPTTSHRRTLSSKSLATTINPRTTGLSSRVQSQPKLCALGKKRATELEFSGISTTDSGGRTKAAVAVVGEKRGIDVDLDMTFLQYWSVFASIFFPLLYSSPPSLPSLPLLSSSPGANLGILVWLLQSNL